MTTSKMWALIVGLILVGGAVIGGVVWRKNQPEVSEFGRLVDPLVPPLPSPKPPPPKSGPGPDEQAIAKAEKSVAPQAPALAPQPKAPAPKAPEPAAGKGEPPHFDVVRVEPNGDSVVAGKGDPNAKVALVEGGKVVAEAKADAGGNFVILPPALPPGDHDLSLRQSTDGKPAADSTQNVAVSVPKKSGDQVVVALAEPGKPTKLLSPPPTAAAPGTANAPAPAEQKPGGAADVATAQPETAVAPPAAIAPKGPDLAIRTVELENGNGFYATGVATPGTQVEIYLNGAHVAGVVAGQDGQWSLTIRKGLTGGRYAVRADALGADRKVIARAEVPFDVPVAMAQDSKPAEAKPAEPAPAPTAAAPAAKTAAAPPAPEPPSAPSPSEVAGLGPDPSLAGPPPGDIQPAVPAPRPDIAAAAKAAASAAPKQAPATMAMAPPPASTAPSAAPMPPPPAAARMVPAAPDKMAVAPAKPADAPPTIAATKPAVEPPKRAEIAAATGAGPAARPTATPASPGEAAPAAAPSAPTTSNAVIEQVETALVIRGDNLWNISRARLGNATRYTQIYTANADQIRNPNLIYPGQVFVMPQK